MKTARVPESIITFRQGKSSVDASQLPNVERVASYLKKYADSKVVIKGYASPEGSVEVNARIAAARAEAVKRSWSTNIKSVHLVSLLKVRV